MRSNKLFLGVLVVAGLAAAYWFLLLAPKREEVTALEGQVTQKQRRSAPPRRRSPGTGRRATATRSRTPA